MDLKTWIENNRTEEDIEMFENFYNRMISIEENPLEHIVIKFNYLRNNTDKIETYIVKFKGQDVLVDRSDWYDEDISFFFQNFRSDLSLCFLSLVGEKSTQYEFDRIMAKYDSFLQSINKLNEKDKYKRKEHTKCFNGDIVITDPCYIEKFDENFYTELTGDTIYGDWSCNVFDKATKESIGKFCSDSGRVCICCLDEIKNKEKFEEWLREYRHCGTIIRNFQGKIPLIYDFEEYEHNGKQCKDLYCYIEGNGNINFITKQTGF